MCFPAGLGVGVQEGTGQMQIFKAHNKVWCLSQTLNILGFVPKDCLLTSAERVQLFVRSREKYFFLAPKGNSLQIREVPESHRVQHQDARLGKDLFCSHSKQL